MGKNSNRSFENTLSLMIIGLCLLLGKFAVVPSELKYPYFIFFAICLGSGTMIIIMNILGMIKDGRKTNNKT